MLKRVNTNVDNKVTLWS